MEDPMEVNWAKTRAFLYGDGLFETMRIRGKKVLFWEDHAERMTQGMKILGMEFRKSEFLSKLQLGIHPLVERNPGDFHGRLRITVFRAGGGNYTPETNVPEVIIHTEPLSGDFAFQPQSLTIFDEISLHATPLSKVKSLNSLPYVLAARHASMRGFDDAVLLSDGYIAETSRANIFARFGDLVVTPGLNRGCLPGTMRKKTIVWLLEGGYEVIESDLIPENLLTADELVITNAIQGILPVKSVEDYTLKHANGQKMSAYLSNQLMRAVSE